MSNLKKVNQDITSTIPALSSVSAEVYAKIFYTAPTLKSGGVRFFTGVKNGTFQIPTLDSSTALYYDGDGSQCGFVPNGVGDFTFGSRSITLRNIKLNREYCKYDFEAMYNGNLSNSGSMLNSDAAAAVYTAMLDTLAQRTAQDIEYTIWQGDTTAGSSPTNLIDGFTKQLTADVASVIDVSKTAWTAANIIAEINKVIAAVPAEVWQKYQPLGQLVMYVSPEAIQLLTIAYATNTSAVGMSLFSEANGVYSYAGIRLIPTYGLSGTFSSNAVCTYVDNLWVATNLQSDVTDLIFSDSDANGGTLDGTVRIKGRMNLGVGYAYPTNIVWYH